MALAELEGRLALRGASHFLDLTWSDKLCLKIIKELFHSVKVQKTRNPFFFFYIFREKKMGCLWFADKMRNLSLHCLHIPKHTPKADIVNIFVHTHFGWLKYDQHGVVIVVGDFSLDASKRDRRWFTQSILEEFVEEAAIPGMVPGPLLILSLILGQSLACERTLCRVWLCQEQFLLAWMGPKILPALPHTASLQRNRKGHGGSHYRK